MVRQDVQLFPGDVRFNLALGADLTDEALMAAVDVANAGPAVEALLRETGEPLFTLGLTKDGHPKHPLYIGYAEQPKGWPAP